MQHPTVPPRRRAVAFVAYALFAAAAATASAQDSRPLAPFAETPAERDARMACFREARFGLFVHWGVYSELAGSWDGKPARGTGEWIFQNAKPPMSRYEDVAKRFDPSDYDPRAWAALAREAGMKYVVITSKHHDGFCLWDSALTDWDVTRTPAKKDLLAPLAEACRAEGLQFGLYFSIMDWRHPDYAPRRAWNDFGAKHGEPRFERFVPYVHGQLEEIVRRFDPALLWFDGEWEPTWTVEHGAALEAALRGWKPSIVMNNRVGKSRNDMAGLDRPGVKKAGDYGTPEQEVPTRGLPGVDWETCMTMNDTWGYRSDDANWKSSETLVRTLVDVVSKGGNFLLNVGPTGKGAIPPESVERLKAVGAWMRTNGEAIHGTTASPFERLAFGRATAKGRTLYLHVFDAPADGALRLPGLRTEIARATVLGAPDAAVSVRRTEDGAVVEVPRGLRTPTAPFAVVRLDLAGPIDVDPLAALPRPGADGTLRLRAEDAVVHDGALCTERLGGGPPSLGCWTDARTWATFDAVLPSTGRYRVFADVAVAPDAAGAELALEVDGRRLARVKTLSTGSWAEFRAADWGAFRIESGRRTFAVRALSKNGDGVLNLRGLRIVIGP
jgi:alpha-L-fucosidase